MYVIMIILMTKSICFNMVKVKYQISNVFELFILNPNKYPKS